MNQRSLLEDTLVELRGISPSESRQDAIDLVQELIDDEKPPTCPDGLPIYPHDEDTPVVPDPLTRMVEDDEDDELRYSPDQTRRPNGEFGEGDGASKAKPSKGKLSPKQAEVKFKEMVPAWVDPSTDPDGDSYKEMQIACDKACLTGKADTDPIAVMVRNNTVPAIDLYRGMTNVPQKLVDQWQTGKEIDLTPRSFSRKEEVAENFGTLHDGEKPERNCCEVQINLTRYSGQQPIHGVSVGKYTKVGGSGRGESEVITGGHFKVLGHLQMGRNVILTVQQVGVF